MSNQMNNAEITRLAKLSSQLVHGLDFPEQCDCTSARNALLQEMDRLDHVYMDSEFLFELRAAVLGRPVRKQALYSLTHELVREARGQHVHAQAGSLLPAAGAMVHSALPGSADNRSAHAPRLS